MSAIQEEKKHECHFDLTKYGRDDQGFYLDCITCGKTHFYACDTEGELYELFGLNDDDDE